MEKKITVYVVTCNDIEQVYATKSRANEALAILNTFGQSAELKQEKRTVTLV